MMKRILFTIYFIILLISHYACSKNEFYYGRSNPADWAESQQSGCGNLIRDSFMLELGYPAGMTKYSNYRALFVLDPESGRYIQTDVDDSLEVSNDYAVLVKYGLHVVSGTDTFTYQKWTSTKSKRFHSMKSICDSLGFVIE